MKIYEDCHRKSFVPCLKVKAINFFERAGRAREINLWDAVSIVRDGDAPPYQGPLTETDLETTLPRAAEEARDARLNALLFNRIADFVNSHRVVLSLPKLDPAEIKQGVEEGRGKMKKMMSMMMMGFAMKMAAAVPMAVGMLFLLAGKALIISKIALVLTLIMALKKLISQKQSHSHEVTWHTGGGWDRRSFLLPHPAAHDLAYRGHIINTLSSPGKH
ncbi:UNVERIFIED_CONTAM: hypothetical protein PYX00_004762 [Menopon gallinae]|uniref:Uncharacterized protein n=1 Tax=Menopon gallinae TaxID=328185 RepID=A0AAW2I7R3_9NEOP